MRDYKEEFSQRIEFIKNVIRDANATGIVYGNSGGKDSTLVGILCMAACTETLSVIMPCSSSRNYGEDKRDALAVAEKYNIKSMLIDLKDTKSELMNKLTAQFQITTSAQANISPRLRMITLYTIAQSKNYLVAGTSNLSEYYTGYFTKWGDGACDFNPIADLTVTEVYEFLRYLNAPENIIKKVPSGGLLEGQTDEAEMGVTYAEIDSFIKTGEANTETMDKIKQLHKKSMHKRNMPLFYGN